ncbi:MAG: FAD-dependent oxidoreductase [Actinomycetota bacterium]
MTRLVVVGASLAGLHAAVAARRAGFEGDISLVGDEPHYPYDRPPLSKNYLAGTIEAEALRLRPAADPAETGVDWELGRTATGFEPSPDGGGTVTLDDGRRLAGDGVVIATGCRVRTLPGTDRLAGVHVIRTLDNATALRAALADGPRRVVVIGCGFIGGEVAATARQAGHDVTIVEAASAPLQRVLDTESGLAVAELHRSHGVEVHLGVGVARLDDADGVVRTVVLDDGTELAADVVVIGIGVVPNTEWLADSGLLLDDGVVTDAYCVAAPGVVAAGDVARWPHRGSGEALTRIEQWDNAVEMGRYVGTRLVHLLTGDGAEEAEPFDPVPWFWSDQYDRKIQLAGAAADGHETVQGTVAEQRFVRLFLDDGGRVTGTLCWNRPRQAILARRLLATGADADEFRQKLA